MGAEPGPDAGFGFLDGDFGFGLGLDLAAFSSAAAFLLGFLGEALALSLSGVSSSSESAAAAAEDLAAAFEEVAAFFFVVAVGADFFAPFELQVVRAHSERERELRAV